MSMRRCKRCRVQMDKIWMGEGNWHEHWECLNCHMTLEVDKDWEGRMEIKWGDQKESNEHPNRDQTPF